MLGANRNGCRLPDKAPGESRSLLVELIGPAGAGKTTLARALSLAAERIQLGTPLQLRKLRHVPFFFTHAVPLVPMLSRSRRNDRRFTWEEIKAIVYIEGWHRILKRQASRNITAILLDHGPVFKLATLNEFGPAMLRDRDFEGWWDRMLKQWAMALDIVIWLDAPDSILLDRINSRVQGHLTKGRSENEAFQFLSRYRRSYEEIVAKLTAVRGPKLLHFNTSRESPKEIAEALLEVFDSRLNDE